MHQLTIDDNARITTVTDHADFGDAHHALLQYVIGADYYLHAVHNETAHTTYELITQGTPTDPRAPQVAGRAVIEHRATAELPVPAPYFVAAEARRWITDHQVDWDFGDPRTYPVAVLNLAHAEAHRALRAGSLITEAASLAGATDAAIPNIATLEMVRCNAIENTTTVVTPAQIADTVQQLLPAGATAQQAAALVWYYALIQWGANAS